jgi:hypothetical protein
MYARALCGRADNLALATPCAIHWPFAAPVLSGASAHLQVPKRVVLAVARLAVEVMRVFVLLCPCAPVVLSDLLSQPAQGTCIGGVEYGACRPLLDLRGVAVCPVVLLRDLSLTAETVQRTLWQTLVPAAAPLLPTTLAPVALQHPAAFRHLTATHRCGCDPTSVLGDQTRAKSVDGGACVPVSLNSS